MFPGWIPAWARIYWRWFIYCRISISKYFSFSSLQGLQSLCAKIFGEGSTWFCHYSPKHTCDHWCFCITIVVIGARYKSFPSPCQIMERLQSLVQTRLSFTKSRFSGIAHVQYTVCDALFSCQNWSDDQVNNKALLLKATCNYLPIKNRVVSASLDFDVDTPYYRLRAWSTQTENNGQSFSYQPKAGFSGTDEFKLEVFDGQSI